jgi:hypothetical protein
MSRLDMVTFYPTIPSDAANLDKAFLTRRCDVSVREGD